MAWTAQGLRQNERCFLHTSSWGEQLQGLEAADQHFWNRRSARLGPLDKVTALVEDFVSGQAEARFYPPDGTAMVPVFKRRRPPNHRLVTMRTFETRTFGFFNPNGTFVAIFLGETDKLKANGNKLYAAYAKAALKFIDESFCPTEVDDETDVANFLT